MQTDIDPRDLIGHKAVDRNGDKIGTVDEVYLDDATGDPEWAAVRTGIFGRDAFVPLATSQFIGEELRVPYEKSQVKESPDFGAGQHLSPAQELQLYRYYGLEVPGSPESSQGNGSGSAANGTGADQGAPGQGAQAGQAGHNGHNGHAGEAAAAAAAGGAAGTAAARPGADDTRGMGIGPETGPAAAADRREQSGAAGTSGAPEQAGLTSRDEPVSGGAGTGGTRAMEATGPGAASGAAGTPGAAGTAGAAGATEKSGPGTSATSGAPSSAQGYGSAGGRTSAFFDSPTGTAAPAAAGEREAAGAHNGSRAGDGLPEALEVLCREERLEITTEWRELGRARLRKFVTTENVERRVPVVRERVRVERVRLGEEERSRLSEEDIETATQEVPLHEERVVVRKRVVPVERVRLVTERVTEEQIVREQIRREQVEVHDAGRTAEAGAGAGTATGAGVQQTGQATQGQTTQTAQAGQSASASPYGQSSPYLSSPAHSPAQSTGRSGEHAPFTGEHGPTDRPGQSTQHGQAQRPDQDPGRSYGH